MNTIERLSTLVLFLSLFLSNPAAAQTARQYPNYPSETPEHFQEKTDSFDYTRREVMVPMRDGVKLFTVILIPKGAKDAPILLTRTPYNAHDMTAHDPRGGEGRGEELSSHF